MYSMLLMFLPLRVYPSNFVSIQLAVHIKHSIVINWVVVGSLMDNPHISGNKGTYHLPSIINSSWPLKVKCIDCKFQLFGV